MSDECDGIELGWDGWLSKVVGSLRAPSVLIRILIWVEKDRLKSEKKDIKLKCDSHSNKHVSWRPPYTIVDLNAILGVPKGSGKLVNDYVHLNDLL